MKNFFIQLWCLLFPTASTAEQIQEEEDEQDLTTITQAVTDAIMMIDEPQPELTKVDLDAFKANAIEAEIEKVDTELGQEIADALYYDDVLIEGCHCKSKKTA